MVVDVGPYGLWSETVRIRLGITRSRPVEPINDVDTVMRWLFLNLDDAIKQPGWTRKQAVGLIFVRWLYDTGRLTS